MLFKSAIFTQASGSIGGATFSHNKGGMYVRSRAIPTDPNTQYQAAVRAILAQVSTGWRELASAVRAGWADYAAQTPITNALGDTVYLSGQQWYIAGMVPRLNGGLSLVATAPETPGMLELTPPDIPSVTSNDNTFAISYVNTDSWAGEVGGALLVQAGKPQGAGVNFFKGPWRFLGKVNGALTPPTSPTNMLAEWNVPENSRNWVRFRAVGADGRISQPYIAGPSVAYDGS